MSSDERAARNRANAQKSTGPTSAWGKAVVSQNARRHGATARPDPTSVVAWARVILDAPDLTADDILSDDGRILSALALAEAEVRLFSAQEAFDAFESGDTPASETSGGMDQAKADLLSAFKEKKITAQDMQREMLLLGEITQMMAEDARQVGQRHELLKRYLREARGHRKRAFQNWLDFLRDEATPTQQAA